MIGLTFVELKQVFDQSKYFEVKITFSLSCLILAILFINIESKKTETQRDRERSSHVSSQRRRSAAISGRRAKNDP